MTKKSDPTRCGMPVNVLLPESSIGSDIKYNQNPEMYKIRKLQQWNSMPYKERSLYKVFTEISDICHKNNLPSIILNEAKSIYKIISNTKISRGSIRIVLKQQQFISHVKNVMSSKKLKRNCSYV